jgi:hypothetical protein
MNINDKYYINSNFIKIMNRIQLKGTSMFLATCLMAGMATSCNNNDPGYDNVIPPTVEVTTASISGRVTAISGNPISGAGITATMGDNTLTATTNSEGTYQFESLPAGTYTLEITADNKLSAGGSVTVAAGQTGVWNTRLANVGREVTVSQTAETKEDVKTETLANNTGAEVTVSVTIPSAAVNAGEKIIITPIYSLEDALKTRSASAENPIETRATSTKNAILAGVTLSCSNPNATLKKSVTLDFQIDATVASLVKAQKYVNGNWTEVTKTVENGHVRLQVDAFTSYALFLSVTLNTSSTSESVSFDPSEYNNLYGVLDLSVGQTIYSYKQGAEITSGGSGKQAAYLREILAHHISGSSYGTVSEPFVINVRLPVGTALTLSGKQTVETVTASNSGVSVSGKAYGTVTVSVKTYNRQHTGGGSN